MCHFTATTCSRPPLLPGLFQQSLTFLPLFSSSLNIGASDTVKIKVRSKTFRNKTSIFTAVYKALHYITLYYITLHYITLNPLPISSLRQYCASAVGLLTPRADTPQVLCICSFLCLKGCCPPIQGFLPHSLASLFKCCLLGEA